MPAAADPFARSRICFEHLAEDLSGGRAGEMTHDQLEELVEVRGRELQWQLLQDHLDLRAIREEQALPAGGEARRVAGRGRVERGHERKLATVFGPVTVRRLAFRAPGGPTSTRPMSRCRCRRGGTATGCGARRCARRCAAPTTPPRR